MSRVNTCKTDENVGKIGEPIRYDRRPSILVDGTRDADSVCQILHESSFDTCRVCRKNGAETRHESRTNNVRRC